MRALLLRFSKTRILFIFFVYIFIHISANMSPFGLKFSQMILHTETSKLMYNWSFLFVVLHKPTLLPSTFNIKLAILNAHFSITLFHFICTFSQLDLHVDELVCSKVSFYLISIFHHFSKFCTGSFSGDCEFQRDRRAINQCLPIRAKVLSPSTKHYTRSLSNVIVMSADLLTAVQLKVVNSISDMIGETNMI